MCIILRWKLTLAPGSLPLVIGPVDMGQAAVRHFIEFYGDTNPGFLDGGAISGGLTYLPHSGCPGG
ncbi:exported hypothetical protein [Verrucomicrobia bacterium]|nr:exported hypothetical protein [Verrucomicrobiota bacterium]